jgi:hypothetical protein
VTFPHPLSLLFLTYTYDEPRPILTLVGRPVRAALRGLGGGHARQVPLRSPRLPARRQGRTPGFPPLPNTHQVASLELIHLIHLLRWIAHRIALKLHRFQLSDGGFSF